MNQNITLKWAGIVPTEWGMAGEMLAAAKRIHERTNGQVTVEVYGGGELCPMTEVSANVASGKVDIGWDYGGYNTTLLRSAAAQLPIWPSGQAGCVFAKAMLDKYVRSEMAAAGLVPITYQANNCDDFGFFLEPYYSELFCNKMYTSLADLKGARILSQNDTTSIALSVLGMVPVMIPSTDAATAFSNNQIDGMLMSCWTAMQVQVQDLIVCWVQLHYPQSEDNYWVMNKHTYDSLPTDIRNIVIEEVRNHESYASPSRVPLTRPAREFWNARVQAGSLKMVELTPSEQAFCKQQWEKELVDGWVKHQEAAGLKDARAYMDDLLKFQEAIVAKGLPQYTGPID